MTHLDDITVEDLHALLDSIEGKKPTQRLLAAIAYKNGISQTELADWHNVQRKTIYNWLSRFDDKPLRQAVEDAPRPGRPRKLTPDQQQSLNSILQGQPSEAGYDVPQWTPALVRHYIDETFDVEYSLPSCRRLMNEVEERRKFK